MRYESAPQDSGSVSKQQRIKLVDIAEAVGLDKSTVSLALRSDQRIKPATRKRVMEAAARMGYKPDPHLSQLMGYLRATNDKTQAACIAYLKLYPSGLEGLDQTPFFKAFEDGAKAEMERLGYRIEVFRLLDYRGNLKRLSDVLINRGIQGLIVSPPVGITELEEFDWSRFSAITMGYRLRSPRLCRVVCDQLATIRTVMETLSRRGYRRPLLAYRRGRDEHVNRRWSIAFEGSIHLFPSFVEQSIYSGDPDEGFVEFVRKREIDSVIGLSFDFAQALEVAGIKFPDDLGFALLDKYDGPDGVSCVDQKPFLLGQMAARQLSGFLDRHEVGLFDDPFTVAIHPDWCEGLTLKGESS
ncbi:MAG TPA: LacI family DNA-binding transcriptional regulator [Oceanipulchritudo sp.]|nr:LacI family DNA-binding transcriptional regulator [Oceanipulchritudo sp.]